MKKATKGIAAGVVLGLVVIGLIIGLVVISSKNQGKNPSGGSTEAVAGNVTGTEEQTEYLQNSETEDTGDLATETEITETTEIEDTENDSSEKENSETAAVTYPYYIKVNRTSNCITVYGKDANGNYTVPVKAIACSVGKSGKTPTGVFHTQAKYVWKELYGNCYGQYSTRITGHVLFHSVPYYATKKDRLITSYYNQLGSAASAGCIRLACIDAKWIYDNCPVGTTVEIFDSNEPDPLGKPTSLKIDTSSPYAGWDPTDPDPDNPWKTVTPVISGVKNATVERNEKVDYTSYVTSKDSWGVELDVAVQGTVDSKKCGTYTVTYSVVDSIGNTASQTATFIVQDAKAPVITQNYTVTVMDKTTNIEQMIRDALSITDNGESMDKSKIVLDMTNLTNAMNQKAYGKVTCTATATDAYGNKTNAFSISINYEKEDTAAPVITVLNSGTATVDLTDVTDESARQTAVLNAAMNSIIKGTHYTVSDDVSASDKITCSVTGNYTGETTAGTYDVTLTITATDEAGKTSTAVITIKVTISETVSDTAAEM